MSGFTLFSARDEKIAVSENDQPWDECRFYVQAAFARSLRLLGMWLG